MQLHGKSIESNEKLHYTHCKPNLYEIRQRGIDALFGAACAMTSSIVAKLCGKYDNLRDWRVSRRMG